MTDNKTDSKDKRKNGYYYIDDKAYVSVTTVLKVIAKPALIPWAAKVGATAALENPDWAVEKCVAEVNGKKEEAGERGTIVHGLIEAVCRGNKPDITTIPEKYRGYAEAFLSFARNNIKKHLCSEFTVLSDKHEYAGTGDGISVFNDGLTWLWDVKTSSGIYNEMGLQLSAYRNAEYIMDNVSKKKIEIPKIDKMGIIQLRENGAFTFAEFKDDFGAFLATKKMYEWLFVDDVKRIIKQTLDTKK